MKRLTSYLLALALLLGQAPAWAMVGRCMPMPGSGLRCLRVCAHSADLLTQHGKLPSVGQACARVQTRSVQASLAAVSAPALALPAPSMAVALSASGVRQSSLAFFQRAHAPPCAKPAQAYSSVPVAQGPPALQ